MKLQYKALIAIAIVSLSVRIFFSYSWRDSFDKRGNAFYVIDIARHVVAGEGYCIKKGVPSIDHEPGYPVFLALGYGLFGYNWFGQYFLQIILSIISGFFVFLLGKKIKSATVGLVASVYFLFYPYLLTQSLSIIDTTLFIFLLLLLLYLYQIAAARNNIILTALSGIVMGLLLLTRSSILCFVPFCVIYPFIIRKWKKAIILSASFLLAFICIITPWLIRNYKLVGSPVIATHGGYGLWEGNNEYTYFYLSRDVSLDVISRLDDPPEICKKYSPHPVYYNSPRQSLEAYNAYRDAAFDFIKKNPGEFIALMGLKFVKFYSWIYNPKAESYATLNLKTRTTVYTVSYLPVLIFFLIGIYFVAKDWRKNFLMLALFISYTFAHMIVMGYTRVRLPLDPLMMIYSAIGFFAIFDYFRKKHGE